jgi:hypothetical protein
MVAIVEAILELKPCHISEVRTNLHAYFKTLRIYSGAKNGHTKHNHNFFHTINFFDEMIYLHESNLIARQIQSKDYK